MNFIIKNIAKTHIILLDFVIQNKQDNNLT